MSVNVVRLERVAGIEPASQAWKASALPLSYTRFFNDLIERFSHFYTSAYKSNLAMLAASATMIDTQSTTACAGDL